MQELHTIPVALIEPDPNQPRKAFDEVALQELAESIAHHGLIQPVAVLDLGNGRYRLIYGERRWRAHKLAGLDTIRAIVSANSDPVDILTRQIVENEYQSPLNPIEQALVYQHLLNGGLDGKPLPVVEIAHRFGKSDTTVATYLKLLTLDPPIQSLVAAGKWPTDPRATAAILSVPDTEARVALARRLTEEGKRVNIPALIRSCAVLREKVLQAQNGRFPTPPSGSEAEARRVAKVALPQVGQAPGGRLRSVAAATCADCDWRSTAGLDEPAWSVLQTAVGGTCEKCRYKMGGNDLSVCNDCPLPAMLIKLAKAVET